MGAKKSTKLIDARNDFVLLGVEYEVFNYSFNKRYGVSCITTHCGSKIPAVDIYNTQEMREYLKSKNFFRNMAGGRRRKGILFEEAQFSDEEFVDFLKEYKTDFDIHLSMLMRDSGARPFRLRTKDGKAFSERTTLDILGLADFVHINTNPTKCTYTFDNGERCGEEASETQKFVRLKGESLWIPAPYDPDHVIEIGGVGSDLVEEHKEEDRPYEVMYKPRDVTHFIDPPVIKWQDEQGLVEIIKSLYKQGKGPFIATRAL